MNKFFVLVLLFLIAPVISFGQISIEKNLKLGDKDDQVIELKNFLIKEGVYKRFLGIEFRKKHFNKKTQKALKEWQKSKSLSETGELDDTTKVSVNKILISESNVAEKVAEKMPEKTAPISEETKKETEPVVSKEIPKDTFAGISKAETIGGEDSFAFGRARLFIVMLENEQGGPDSQIEILASRLVKLEISSKENKVSIEPDEIIYSPVTLTLRGFVPNTTYYQFTDTLENMKQVKTDSLGMLTTSLDASIKNGIGISPTKTVDTN